MARKAGRRRRSGHRALVWGALLAYLVLAGLATWFFLWGYDRLRTHPRFAVASLSVTSETPVVAREVREQLSWVTGRNIFNLDLNRVKCEVLEHIWVEDALVRRDMPNRVSVLLRERRAEGLVLLDSGLHVVDGDGRVICRASESAKLIDVPVLTGVEQSEDRNLAIRRGLKVLGDLRDASLVFWGRVESLDVSDMNDFVVRLSHLEPVVHLGDHVLKSNVRNYLAIADHVHARYPEMEYVELGYASQVIIKPRVMERLD